MSDKYRNRTLRAATAAFIAAMLPELLEAISEVAHNHGYAIAVHGSLSRDIDLVAIPWIEHAEGPDELVHSIRGAIAGLLGRAYVHVNDDKSLKWSEMPHGRRAITIIHAGFAAEIDLSVMPRIETAEELK